MTQNDLIELYKKHYRYAKRLARKYFSDPFEAEDLVQDTFAEIVAKWNTFDPNRSSFAGWIRGFMRYEFLNYRQKQRPRECVWDLSAPDSWEAMPPPSHDYYLHKLMLEMKPAHQELIYLYFFQDMSFVEIAKIKNVVPSALENKMKRALADLQRRAGAEQLRVKLNKGRYIPLKSCAHA